MPNSFVKYLLLFISLIAIIGGGYHFFLKFNRNWDCINYKVIRGVVFSGKNIVDGADASSFLCIDSFYAKDNHSVYWIGMLVQGAEPLSFATINDSYSKDKYHVYFCNLMIDSADVLSFKIIDYPYSKDKNHVFFQNKIIHYADPLNFMILSNGYSKDKNYVFYADPLIMARIEDADPSSFVVFNMFLVKDKTTVYKQSSSGEFKKLTKIDAATFDTLPNDFYADKTYLYSTQADVLAKLDTFNLKSFFKESR